MMKIRVDKGNPLYIGKTFCPVGVVKSVERDVFVKFSASISGGVRFENDMTIISGTLPKSAEDKKADSLVKNELTVDTMKDKELEPFIFDPEKHTIEHRGGGKWFVMDGVEKALDRPLTAEEKEKYEAEMVGSI